MFGGSRSSVLSIRNNDIIAAHQVMAKYMNSMDMDFEKRVASLKKFYSLIRFATAMKETNTNPMLTIVSNERIFSMDEILEHADTLMSLPVVSQADWQVLAYFQSRQGHIDDAEQTWRKAAEIGIKSENRWTGLRDYMFFLDNNNLRDKAYEYWRYYNTESLSLKSLVEYHDLIQSLSDQT